MCEPPGNLTAVSAPHHWAVFPNYLLPTTVENAASHRANLRARPEILSGQFGDDQIAELVAVGIVVELDHLGLVKPAFFHQGVGLGQD